MFVIKLLKITKKKKNEGEEGKININYLDLTNLSSIFVNEKDKDSNFINEETFEEFDI